MAAPAIVMPALVAGIHVFLGAREKLKAWMPGTKRALTPVFDGLWPGMTGRGTDAR